MLEDNKIETPTLTQQWIYRGLILTIILIATWLRLWRLLDTPPGLDYDEAINGLDAIWMLKSKTPYLFVLSTQGREALFLYPIALFTALLGATPYTLRLTSVFVGIVTIPLVYWLTLVLFRHNSQRYWLALIAAAGLAVSLWHVSMSRVAFRAILILPFYILVSGLFWCGWQSQLYQKAKQTIGYFLAAGVILGLSQYSYFPARLFPLIFMLFAVIVWLRIRSRHGSKLANPWVGLLVMGGASGLVFIPMAILFLNNGQAFDNRISQVAFEVQWTADGMIALIKHLGQAFRLFAGGADPRIRHHLIERPVIDWLILFAFWVGVVVAVRQWRQPKFLFLLLSVFVLWLPSVLSVDPIHNLRAAGLLGAFFILVAVGLLRFVTWANKRASFPLRQFQIGLISFGLVLTVSGGTNTIGYFVQWANHPLVYQEYNGRYIELAQYATTLTKTADVIIPYNFYSYAPVRYLLRNHFQEKLTLPFSPLERKTENRSIIYLNGLDPKPSSQSVWLTYDQAGRGVAYLSDSLQELENELFQPVLGKRGNLIATGQTVNETTLAQIYRREPIVTTPFVWNNHIRLAGYELESSLVTPGERGVITLYWHGIKEPDMDFNTFIQVLNHRGEPISQLEEIIIDNDIQYYDNRDGFVARQHLLWTGADTPSGLYLLRFGLFNPETGERLPITTADGQVIGDQIALAPFYVSTAGDDPRLPAVSLHAGLGQMINLLGYSLNQPLDQNLTEEVIVTLYWQAINPITEDYTTFVQLLDTNNRIISQRDAQPLAGLYPTSQWQSGQIMMTEFPLSLDGDLTAGTYRLTTGMYNFATGKRLPTFDSERQPLPDDMITLTQITIP